MFINLTNLALSTLFASLWCTDYFFLNKRNTLLDIGMNSIHINKHTLAYLFMTLLQNSDFFGKTAYRFLMFLCIFPTYFFPRNPKIITIFLPKKLFKKLFNFEVIIFLFNTDETQTLIFRMFYMLIEYFMLVFMIRT